jgi:CBS domain containing-hemolysin-like protein
MMLIDDLCQVLEIDLTDTEADTVGGYVTESLGKIGKIGDRFCIDRYEGCVTDMEGKRVARIQIEPSERSVHRGEDRGQAGAFNA